METSLEDTTRPGSGKRRSKLARSLLQLAIAAGGVYLAWRLVESLSWQDLASRIREASPAPLIVAVLLLIARWYIWQARWGLSLERAGHESGFVRRSCALMASVFVNHVALRFFGGVLRARYIAAGRSGAFARHYGIVLFDQLAHQVATTIYTWLMVAYVLYALGWPIQGVVAVVLLVVLAATVPTVVGREGFLRKLATRWAERASRSRRLHGLVQHGSEIPRVLANLLTSLPHALKTAALTWAYIAANVLAQWILFRAIGADIPLLTVAAVLGIGSVIGTLTGLPGGLGPMEAALIGGYSLFGIGRLEATAGTLLYRGLHYLLVLGLGLPSLIAAELGINRKPLD